MKNLENYGVQELNSKEMRSIEGGGIWDKIARALWDTAVGAAVESVIVAAANSLTAEQASDYMKYRRM